MRLATQELVPVSILSARRFVILLVATLVWTFGAVACGVQEGQEEVEKARQVEKQMEKKQQELEKKLQESQ
jgi:Cys-tRNA synthase (O-phospho-L-seryl-tRNA:Cys-tRNA synthase)